jgi:hypothetical protein
MAARRWYVYKILVDGSLAYIGKGCGKRAAVSAKRLRGTPEIIRTYAREWAALRLEKRLIAELSPPLNKTSGGEGKSKKSRAPSEGAIQRGWAQAALARHRPIGSVAALIADAYLAAA